MSTSTAPNADLKSSKKKRSKAEAAAVSEATSTPAPGTPTASESAINGMSEFPFLKELQKNLRNATKKLNATAKVDSIIAENPGKSLDDLVAEKKINNDQKAQALKKPTLQANIAQIEQQISHFKQYGEFYEDRIAKQKIELEEAHKKELETARKEAADEATRAGDKALRDGLLAMTRFLRAAATVRVSGDETSSNSRAFEGVLLQVYEGSDDAVSAMMKLIEGSNDQIPAVDGELLDITYDRVKRAAMNYSPPGEVPDATRDQEPQTESQPAETTQPIDESQTTDSAEMTEVQEPSAAEAAAATDIQQHEECPPAQSIVSDNVANPVAQEDVETQPTVSAPAEEPVQKAQPSAETAAPVDDVEQPSTQVRQNSGRGRGFRGRGRGDYYRGRGGHFRGDFRRGRGRGRDGEHRGGRRGGHSAQNSGPSTPPAQ